MKLNDLLLLILAIGFFSCSSETDETLYQSARNAAADNKVEMQYNAYKKIVEGFPASSYRAEALFYLGYLNNNDLKNFDQAKKYYKQFLDEYKTHELAQSAEMELKFMGLPVDSLPFFNSDEKKSKVVVK